MKFPMKSRNTGLPENFDVADLGSENSRIEFVDFGQEAQYPAAEAASSSPRRGQGKDPPPGPAPRPNAGGPFGPKLKNELGSPRGRSGACHPTLLGSPRNGVKPHFVGPTMLPKIGREAVKVDFGTTPKDATGKHSKLALTTRSSRYSRFTASTGAESAEEYCTSESEYEPDTATAKGSSSARAWRPLTGISSIEESSQRMILYPWEIEAMVAQATVATSTRSPPSSPSRFFNSGSEGSGTAHTGNAVAHRQPSPSSSVERAKMFSVTVERREGMRRLGLDTRPLVSDVTGALSVERVRSGGLVDEWNRNQDPQGNSVQGQALTKRRHRIRKGDLIVEVNGLRGNSEQMYKVITTEQSLVLLVMRLPKSQRELAQVVPSSARERAASLRRSASQTREESSAN